MRIQIHSGCKSSSSSAVVLYYFFFETNRFEEQNSDLFESPKTFSKRTRLCMNAIAFCPRRVGVLLFEHAYTVGRIRMRSLHTRLAIRRTKTGTRRKSFFSHTRSTRRNKRYCLISDTSSLRHESYAFRVVDRRTRIGDGGNRKNHRSVLKTLRKTGSVSAVNRSCRTLAAYPVKRLPRTAETTIVFKGVFRWRSTQ